MADSVVCCGLSGGVCGVLGVILDVIFAFFVGRGCNSIIFSSRRSPCIEHRLNKHPHFLLSHGVLNHGMLMKTHPVVLVASYRVENDMMCVGCCPRPAMTGPIVGRKVLLYAAILE